jgi:phenylacetate-CoA ligase
MKAAFSRKNLWNATPLALKKALAPIIGIVPTSYVLGDSFRQKFRWIRENERQNLEWNRAMQTEELRRICMLAAEKSSFYKEHFRKAGFDPGSLTRPEDIQVLPVISRETVIENLNAMCTRSVDASDIDYTTTGGTSGEPLRFYISSNRHAIEYAYLMAGWERAGYKLGSPMAVLRGRTVPFNKQLGMHYEFDPIFRHHYYSNFHTSSSDFDNYVNHMRSLGSITLHAYPSAAYNLAKFVKMSGRPAPKFTAVLLESENVYPEQRELIEKTFGVRCFSAYGHTEKLVAAVECEHSTDYHVWPTYGYCEVLGEDGQPVGPGERGEIVGTGFINSVVPFIRYRTGDHTTLISDRCPKCQRNHMVLRDIRGHRVQEFLVLADGSRVGWTALNMHDDTFDRVARIQFLQERPGEAVLRIVGEQGFSAVDEQRILRNLDVKLLGRLKVTIQRVDSIPLSKSGKAIYVDQRIPKEEIVESGA